MLRGRAEILPVTQVTLTTLASYVSLDTCKINEMKYLQKKKLYFLILKCALLSSGAKQYDITVTMKTQTLIIWVFGCF